MLLVSLALAGCNIPVIEGVVTDVRGEPLPGVVVDVQETGDQDVTNALGEYRVRYAPGEANLRYLKTGFTSGLLRMEVEEPRAVQARPVALWPLPPQKGVYFSDESYRYRPAAAVEPRRYESNNLGVVYGIESWQPVQTNDDSPLLLAHRLPAHGLRAHRVEMTELFVESPRGDDTTIIEVWAKTREIPVEGAYIDDEGQLLEARFPEPLAPASYALHWGALEGDPSVDSRAFLFTVLPPGAPLEEEEEPGEDAEPADENGDEAEDGTSD